MNNELIDDPIKGVVWANKHIQEIEYFVALGKKQLEDNPLDKEALKSISRLEYSLLKWGELLEKWTHQMFQQGKTEEDIAKHAKKVRANAGS